MRVRYTMRSMRALEARYGSLANLNEQLQLLVRGEHLTPFTLMTAVILEGLLHESVTEDDVLDAPASVYPVLRSALVDAINESFPDPGKADEGDQAGEEPPGAISTTSPPSGSVEAMATSGP